MSTDRVHDKEPGLPYHERSSPTAPLGKQVAHHTLRTELTAFIGEFIGTFMVRSYRLFLSVAFCGTQIAVNAVDEQTLNASGTPAPNVSKLLYIAFAFSLSLAVNVAIFADVSGGKFNPVVTMALLITRKINWQHAVHTIISQMIAGMAAAGFVAALFPGPLSIATTLDPSMSIARGLFLEAFVTSMLILTILMLEGGPAKPMYIGMALFIAELCSVYFTGGSLNPARSFGPCVVVGFPGYHWIYWLGPAMGSAVACGAYELIKFVRVDNL
ncbi:Aquaporin-1 [Pleosporales sp. CAS-2024a]